jgi:hypothetical protein
MTDHRKYGQRGTIVAALANPSGRRECQWYDVRFDDRVWGRFLERHLEALHTEGVSENQASAQSVHAV